MNRLFWLVIAIIGAALILLIANDESGVTFGMENSDFARMVYLGAWALVLAPAVLLSGLRLGNIARNLALWLLIALILVAGYQYRYELQ
ncbi:MAG: TIGR02281 family clan AA aspartic protease, partial [Notoacmeibacter sp.]|nr:TIGR02281 family clan AA aspartic protease [Notoacmeibacter sp.]